jgi:outer membrane murein-binding lipoprotein Lpp
MGIGRVMKGVGKSLGIGLAVSLLFGCGNDQKDPYAGMTQQQRLTAAAKKLEDDPNTSAAARRIAAGALQQQQTQDQLQSFENGGN